MAEVRKPGCPSIPASTRDAIRYSDNWSRLSPVLDRRQDGTRSGVWPSHCEYTHATDVGGVKEIIDKESGQLVPPKDPYALEREIENMLDNYTEYDSEKIAIRAAERFGHETVGRILDTIYRRGL